MNFLRKLFSYSPIGIVIYTRKIFKATERIEYQKKFIDFKINKGDKVLDIGSGGNPFPQATHLLDKFPNETHHRYNKLRTDGREFTEGDIQNLPFDDKSFDYVFCSHVLEHVENPGKAMEELMRVGKKGYIEVPTRTTDILSNYTKEKKFHKWHITMLRNTLIFHEYDEWEREDTGDNEYMFKINSYIPNPVRKNFYKHANLFTNMLQWENKFNYFIFSKEGEIIATNTKPND